MVGDDDYFNDDAIVDDKDVALPRSKGKSKPGNAPNIDRRRRLFYGKLLHEKTFGGPRLCTVPLVATCKICFSTGGERVY
jgi:hypothetical protein